MSLSCYICLDSCIGCHFDCISVVTYCFHWWEMQYGCWDLWWHVHKTIFPVLLLRTLFELLFLASWAYPEQKTCDPKHLLQGSLCLRYFFSLHFSLFPWLQGCSCSFFPEAALSSSTGWGYWAEDTHFNFSVLRCPVASSVFLLVLLSSYLSPYIGFRENYIISPEFQLHLKKCASSHQSWLHSAWWSPPKRTGQRLMKTLVIWWQWRWSQMSSSLLEDSNSDWKWGLTNFSSPVSTWGFPYRSW